MQTEITQTILNKVPMLTEEQQRKILEMTETFLNGGTTEDAWAQLRKAVAANRINSGLGDFAAQHDYYIHGTEKQK